MTGVEPGFYKPIDPNTAVYDICFLCGFDNTRLTQEHIFPKWLQHEFSLWDQKLQITNDSLIPYRKLTVNCCESCNNDHLSRLEKEFIKLKAKRFKDLSFLEEVTVFQWTAKVLYSTRFKEMSLMQDRRKPSDGTILTPKQLESYAALHLLMQSIRFDSTYEDPRPWSIFVVDCDDDSFYYLNNIEAFCFAMKLGGTGIIIAYEENHILSTYLDRLNKVKGIPLSTQQFIEISVHVIYGALLKENVPKYITAYNSTHNTITYNTVGHLYSRNWNDKEFCYHLNHYFKVCGFIEEDVFFAEDGNVTTTLVGENHTSMLM